MVESDHSDMDESDDDEVVDMGTAVNKEASPSAQPDDFAELRERNGSGVVNTRISDRESDYHKRRNNRVALDVDSEGNKLSYREIMENQEVEREKAELEEKVRLSESGTFRPHSHPHLH